jgi:hypothetical protein
VAGAYFALRTWVFGDPFRFYQGTSPARALLSGHWLGALAGVGEWWPRALPEAVPRKLYAGAALLLAIAAVSASLVDARARRALAAVTLALLGAAALLFSHWGWSASGEGGRVLYAIAAIAALALALPLRSPARRLRRAAWIVALVLLGSGLALTRGAVERRAAAGAEMNALTTALLATADAMPRESFAIVVVPDRLGAIPFARNGQGGMMLPPVQPRSLAPHLVVQLREELPRWPEMLRRNIVGRLKAEPLADVTARPDADASGRPLLLPDRYYCWNPRAHALVALPIEFDPEFRDWDATWVRALDEAGCHE